MYGDSGHKMMRRKGGPNKGGSVAGKLPGDPSEEIEAMVVRLVF